MVAMYRKIPTTSAADVQLALRAADWNKSAAARRLGVSRPTLYRLMRQHGIVETRGTVIVLDA
jgi:transcriptional regulator of acetoin/glycerol metabolism